MVFRFSSPILPRFRALPLLTALSTTALLLGCGVEAGPGSGDSDPESPSKTGTIDLNLQLAEGVEVDEVGYVISGNDFEKSGTTGLSQSSKLRLVIGGIPEGQGYTIGLSAVGKADDRITCSGSATFDIESKKTTKVKVRLRCRLPGNGTVVVTGDTNVCPQVDELTLLPGQVDVGGTAQLTARASDPDELPSTLSYAWSSTGGELISTSDTMATITCLEPGDIDVTLEVSDGDCEDALTATVVCDEGSQEALLLWNEVESSGGEPDDWAELYNAGAAAADISGWTFLDNDDTHVYIIPEGTVVEPGEYEIIEGMDFGLGSGDSVRLVDPDGNLVVSYTWEGHAPTTYGRCPDVTGDWAITTASTKGAPNDCSPLVTFNEVESSGGEPDDWAEIYNAGVNQADLSGWVFKDNDDEHVYVLPEGSVIPVGGYLVLDANVFGFGLGGSDSVRLFNPEGALVAEYSWEGHATTTYGRCPDGGGEFVTTQQPTKGAENACALSVKLNEIESSGGTPGDWFELYNLSDEATDISGWSFKDNDDTHVYVFPEGTLLGARDYLTVDDDVFGFGLGGGDSARLFDQNDVLVDSYTYLDHAPTTYGRCPDGTGDFAVTLSSTKGGPNDCSLDPGTTFPWPGSEAVENVDPENSFPSNLSGLHYEPGARVLWGALNGPSKLYRLVQGGAEWLPDGGDWVDGKLLSYPDGTGQPDAEGVTRAEWSAPGIYVSTERNNEASGTSRLSVLRFDETQSGSTLVATHEWELTAQLPTVGANAGFEGITWIPDSAWMAGGFEDQLLGKLYDPADYPNHGTGLFVVGVEGTGMLHVLSLDHVTGDAFVVASAASGQPTIMGLEFDRDTQALWAICDNSCENESTVLGFTDGLLSVKARFARPTSLPNGNNEGFALMNEAECTGGTKGAFWADDSNTAGHALREGSLSCGLSF